MNVLVIGTGEVGKGILGLYNGLDKYSNNIDSMDIDPINKPKYDYNVMNICFPYSKDFIENVVEYMNRYTPELTIIHSTVPVGTTKEIYDITKENIIHSLCMGKHPHLTESFKTFKKIIGSTSKEAEILAYNHLSGIGLRCSLFNSSDETEAAKILSTTKYSWDILYMKLAHEYCMKHGLSFLNVYTSTTGIYNEGYSKMGNNEYLRPNLKYMGKGAGGHCILRNCDLIDKEFLPAKLFKEKIKEGY